MNIQGKVPLNWAMNESVSPATRAPRSTQVRARESRARESAVYIYLYLWPEREFPRLFQGFYCRIEM